MSDTITRSQAQKGKFPSDMTHYRRHQAAKYFREHPLARRVTFIEAYVHRSYLREPNRTEILHLMSSSGRYGKPQRTILGKLVGRANWERKQREEAEERQRAADAERARMAEFEAAIPEDRRGCFRVGPATSYGYSGRGGCYIWENLHDVGGGFADYCKTPEDVAAHVARNAKDHDRTYHPDRHTS